MFCLVVIQDFHVDQHRYKMVENEKENRGKPQSEEEINFNKLKCLFS